MNYEHKGIAINFLEGTGEFGATVNGEFITAPSLASLKRKLDKVTVFNPFTALTTKGHLVTGEYRVTVVGVRKARGKYGYDADAHYRVGHHEVHPKYLYADTPENEAALKELDETRSRHQEESEKLRLRHAEEYNAIHDKLVNLPKPEVK